MNAFPWDTYAHVYIITLIKYHFCITYRMYIQSRNFHHGKSMRHGIGIYMYVYNECILNATLQSTNQEEENSD